MIMIMTTTMTKYCNCYCCHKNCKTMMNSVVHSIFSIQQYVGSVEVKHKEVMDKSRKIYSLKKEEEEEK